MKHKISEQAKNEALCKTDFKCSMRNYIKKIQIASFIYWCHKNKRLDLLSSTDLKIK